MACRNIRRWRPSAGLTGQDDPVNTTLYTVSVWVLPLVIAITFHEAAHGFVAHHFGDNTAWDQGRVSFNPLRHIDPFGTLIMPAILLLSHSPFLFGYAKPVPVNFRALRNPRTDMVWVALAGPAAGRRPGRGRPAAPRAGGSAGPAGAVRDADPDRNSDRAAAGRFAVRSK